MTGAGRGWAVRAAGDILAGAGAAADLGGQCGAECGGRGGARRAGILTNTTIDEGL
jgi:hypothetical protein